MRKSAIIAMGAALFGCGTLGTCANCDDKKPTDDTPVGTQTATATPSVAPAPSASASDAPKDAAPVNTADVVPLSVPQMILSVKPPMPAGPAQSCGVYDGPVCRKECMNGNCRQDCDGVECDFTCLGGYCRQLCGDHAKCRMTCTGGHCMQLCLRSEGCIKECKGGDCS